MPGRNPFLIAKEYVQSGELPQVRKNALTALAALDGPESRALISEVALTESDPEVRERVQAEIASMPVEQARQVLKPALDDLNVPERCRRAYALLGELRNRGMSFDFPNLPVATRLRLAKSMRDHLYPKRGLKFHFRTVRGVLAGTFLAWLAVLVFCIRAFDIHLETGSTLGYLILSCSLAAGIAVGATALTSPVRFYADIKGGGLLDMAMAALVGLGLSFAAALIRLLQWQQWPPDFSLLLFSAPLAAAGVRAGTLSAFGWAKSGWRNGLIQMAVGGSCGVAIYDLALMVSGKTGDYFLAVAWMMIVPSSYGLAAAFAWIDSRSAAFPVAPRYARAAALGLTLVTAVFTLLPLVHLPAADIKVEDPLAQAERRIDLRQVPASISFKPAYPSYLIYEVLVDGKPENSYQPSLSYQLLRSDTKKEIQPL
jgi:hypothetical protein